MAEAIANTKIEKNQFEKPEKPLKLPFTRSRSQVDTDNNEDDQDTTPDKEPQSRDSNDDKILTPTN